MNLPAPVTLADPPVRQDEPGRAESASAHPEPFRLGHRPALDGLRGVAILLVLWFHVRPASVSLRGGFVGVDLFFALSGFLITALLLEERMRFGAVDLPKFYARRFLRLAPALLLLLAVYATVAWYRAPEPRLHLWAVVWAGAYLSNWVRALGTPSTMGWLGHTWSLSVEEQFYLAWPLLLLLLVRLLGVRPALAVAVLGLATAGWAWRVDLQLSGAVPHRLYNGLDVRADALLVGCALAVALHTGAIRLGPGLGKHLAGLVPAAIGVLVVAVLAARWDKPATIAVGYTLPAACGAVLILALLNDPASPLARFFDAGVLRWLGRLSYGIYLWHYPVFRSTEHAMGNAWVIPVAVPTSILLAYLSYRLVEAPVLRLKSRFKRV